MAGRSSANRQSRNATARRCGVVMGGAVGAFVAAAAMATGSAAPAKADFEELLDPIIQPLLTSFTDSLSGFDPAAAVDITSWTDSLLSSLNSFDLVLPTAESAAAVGAAAEPAAAAGTIPLTVLEGTEPAVYATIDGGSSSVPLLVDTGSAGLVVPLTDLGSTSTQQLTNLFDLGFPTGISESGYSGGVDYIYLTYNDVPVDYAGGVTTDGPVDVEVYSWDPSNLGSLFSNDAFQSFLGDNKVDGILGIGDNASGPTTSPFADYGGVLVDVPDGKLVLDSTNPLDSYASTSGAPISTVLESVNGGTPVSVSDNIDSGGVFGTIPSSLVSGSSVPSGTVITVDNAAGQQLYTYTTTGNFDVGTGTGVSDAPTVVSGTSIDSGVIPYLDHPVYLDYANDTLYFDDIPPN
ncbi:MAG: hypothetical protein QOE52_617 [Mycobacterium sp.]|jgi:hypothetical protein|nr:hypothetical protein [Mycobacterium sp.]MDT5341433.1 hypothetical protein [Mycobacterium sp.]